jgi:hypothetical protein
LLGCEAESNPYEHLKEVSGTRARYSNLERGQALTPVILATQEAEIRRFVVKQPQADNS